MISFLTGKIVELLPSQLAIDVGGVGYSVTPSPRLVAALRVGEISTVQVHLVVREDAWTLYGFVDSAEKAMFETLQKVSGVGPKLALTILATSTPAELATALSQGDEAALVRIPGVGKKSAARLILELADRLPKTQISAAGADVVQALINLGWPSRDVENVVAAIYLETPDLEVAAALKLGLSRLSKGGK